MNKDYIDLQEKEIELIFDLLELYTDNANKKIYSELEKIYTTDENIKNQLFESLGRIEDFHTDEIKKYFKLGYSLCMKKNFS